MNIRCLLILSLAAGFSLCTATADAQDAPCLGDVARQQRQQKERSKTSQSKAGKAPKVITNEQIPEKAASAPEASSDDSPSASGFSNGEKQPPDDMRSEIQMQKTQIDSLQKQIEEVNQSIRFAPANCVGHCAEWNQRQREKQNQVERMQVQLEEQKKRLEEMQDSARKQGYGSSVYDP